jgi:hypothetical protein
LHLIIEARFPIADAPSLRDMVEPLFSKDKVEALKPYIQKTAEDLLESMIAGGCDKPVDLIDKFALPVPSYVRYPPENYTWPKVLMVI